MKKLVALLLALVMVLGMTACAGESETTTDNNNTTSTVEIPDVPDYTAEDTSSIPGLEDGVLTVGMECAYAPYNWMQMDDSNGAVPISNMDGGYANGYDVMIAKRICEAYGWELEIQQISWEGLTPALQAGTIDAPRTANLQMPSPSATWPAAAAPPRPAPSGMTPACRRSPTPKSCPPLRRRLP